MMNHGLYHARLTSQLFAVSRAGLGLWALGFGHGRPRSSQSPKSKAQSLREKARISPAGGMIFLACRVILRHALFILHPSSFLLILLALPLRAENKFDQWGRLEHIQLGKGWMPLRSDVKVPLKGWGKILELSAVKPLADSAGGKKMWKATLGEGVELAAEVEQAVSEVEGKLLYELRATGKGKLDIEGVYFWLDFPAERFAGGSYKTGADAAQGGMPLSGVLPRVLPDDFRLCSAVTNRLTLADASGKAQVILELDPLAHVLVQDGRKWGQHFNVLVDVHTGNLAEGQTATLRAKLSAAGEVEDAPAKLVLDRAATRYRLIGVGGNYCFNLESPVTRYTLDNLKAGFARTEMTLVKWAPDSEAVAPGRTDWRKLVAGDVPGSRLRLEFETMRELSRKKIPFSATIWQLPAWAYTQPPGSRNMNNQIAGDKWPYVLNCITTYLLYAKEKYGAEADYFSFNEPNIGCRVAFDEIAHRDALKRLGAHFAQAGLKTKLFLGDVSCPRNTLDYTDEAVKDPQAMKYVGALSVHSWGGAKPEEYAAWADAAAKLGLPLIVAEAGVDAGAWQGGKYQNFQYAMQEMVHYQELFLHARPQAIMLWEFTGDYSLLAVNPSDKTKLQMTERFCLQKHWCDLTPPGSEALASSSDNNSIMFSCFRFQVSSFKLNDRDAEPETRNLKPETSLAYGYTLHLSNSRWSRRANVEGLPPEIKTLNVVRTSHGEMFKQQAPIAVVDGKLTLELPGQSLTTLTTLPIPELKEP